MISNENKSICARCTNRCCDHMPGAYFPEQLKEITINSILELFQQGYIIDWWEGDPRKGLTIPEQLPQAYYLRPAIVGINKLFHPAYNGKCNFLTDTGCKLDFKSRPLECKTLVPNEIAPGKDCKPDMNYVKKAAAIAWIPYQDLIVKAAELFENIKH